MQKSDHGTCFIIMPFTVREADLPRYYGDENHWNEVYNGFIVPAVIQAGLISERDDDDWASRLITENIWKKIERSDVVLCDLSASNANVYLELGWALRSDKRFVLIRDDITPINFDVNQYYTYQYSHRLQPSDVKNSVNELSDVLKVTLADEQRPYSIVSKLSLQLQATKAVKDGNIEVSLLRELLSEIRSRRMPQTGTTHPLTRPETTFSAIKTQEDLGKMLIGTTWRKKNDVEMLMFQDETTFYNNHAGHPSWRKNTYELRDRLGSMRLFWSLHNDYTDCSFHDGFTKFVELPDTAECVWSIVAEKPHAPWSI